jgi:hypothetical protein
MVSNGGKQVIVKAIPVNITSARELMRVLCNTAEGGIYITILVSECWDLQARDRNLQR